MTNILQNRDTVYVLQKDTNDDVTIVTFTPGALPHILGRILSLLWEHLANNTGQRTTYRTQTTELQSLPMTEWKIARTHIQFPTVGVKKRSVSVPFCWLLSIPSRLVPFHFFPFLAVPFRSVLFHPFPPVQCALG